MRLTQMTVPNDLGRDRRRDGKSRPRQGALRITGRVPIPRPAAASEQPAREVGQQLRTERGPVSGLGRSDPFRIPAKSS